MELEELRHLEEAQRQAEAAVVHERSALFWEEHGDPERAEEERLRADLAYRASKRARNEAGFAQQTN
jgi:hypothetical protein